MLCWGEAGERGIALQTLIITAVLVLMAGGAGVLVVAVTRSASDDLANQTPSLEGNPCNEVELYSLEHAATGAFGSNEGLQGSAPGCIPVCYLNFRGHEADKGYLTLGIQMAINPGVPVDFLTNVRTYFESDSIRSGLSTLDWKASVRNFLTTELEEGTVVTGNVEFLELPGKLFLMKDKIHFFAADVPGGLRFADGIKFVHDYEVFGVRLNRDKDGCEPFDALGEGVGGPDGA